MVFLGFFFKKVLTRFLIFHIIVEDNGAHDLTQIARGVNEGISDFLAF